MSEATFQQDIKKVIIHLQGELQTLRTGRANPHMVEHITVEVYGSNMELKGVASVGVADTKTLIIEPWDKALMMDIEKAISKADIGVTPQNDGSVIRIVFPELTEERRKEMVKQVKKIGESTKISVRNLRHKEMNDLDNRGLSDDDKKVEESNVQELVDKANKEVDEFMKKKEQELMTV